jgi:NDP-sugar pyrophosphorylase family protein
MKAMILAAGLGTRLRPLTNTRPKALVDISGRTLLEITLARLRSFGIHEVIVNVHHFADMVVDYLKSHNNFGMRIEISREDDLLLDTGGGLKKAAWFFLEGSQRTAKKQSGVVIPSVARNTGKTSSQSKSARHSPLATRHSLAEPFLLHNVDVISNIDFRRMLQFHNENHALATLAVQSRASSRLLLFNEHSQLVGRASGTGIPACAPTPSSAPDQSTGRRDDSTMRRLQPPRTARQGTASAMPKSAGKKRALAPEGTPLHPLAFSGIHVISPRLLPMLTEDGVFSIIDAYLRLVAQGEKILAFRADQYYWRDLGRPSDLSQAALDLQQQML